MAHLWGNYSYIKPILRGGTFLRKRHPWVPRHKGSVGTDIDLGKGFLFNARATIVGSRYFISDWGNQVDRLDGYYTLDAKLSYSWKGLRAFVGVNNLTNQKYAEYGPSPMLPGQPNLLSLARAEFLWRNLVYFLIEGALQNFALNDLKKTNS